MTISSVLQAYQCSLQKPGPCSRVCEAGDAVLQVETKLVEELQDQGLLATPEQPHPRPLRYEDINRLPYLSMVVREAQRLYPVCRSWAQNVCSWH